MLEMQHANDTLVFGRVKPHLEDALLGLGYVKACTSSGRFKPSPPMETWCSPMRAQPGAQGAPDVNFSTPDCGASGGTYQPPIGMEEHLRMHFATKSTKRTRAKIAAILEPWSSKYDEGRFRAALEHKMGTECPETDFVADHCSGVAFVDPVDAIERLLELPFFASLPTYLMVQ